jgi:hypothetical protein
MFGAEYLGGHPFVLHWLGLAHQSSTTPAASKSFAARKTSANGRLSDGSFIAMPKHEQIHTPQVNAQEKLYLPFFVILLNQPEIFSKDFSFCVVLLFKN